MARKSHIDQLSDNLSHASPSQQQIEVPAEIVVHDGLDYNALIKLLCGKLSAKLEELNIAFHKSVSLNAVIATVGKIFENPKFGQAFLDAVNYYCHRSHLDELQKIPDDYIRQTQESIIGCDKMLKQIDKFQQSLKEMPQDIKQCLIVFFIRPDGIGDFNDISNEARLKLNDLRGALDRIKERQKIDLRRAKKVQSGIKIAQTKRTKLELIRSLVNIVKNVKGASIHAHFIARVIEYWRTNEIPGGGFCDDEFKEITTKKTTKSFESVMRPSTRDSFIRHIEMMKGKG